MYNAGEIGLLHGDDIPRVKIADALARMRYTRVVDPDIHSAKGVDTTLPKSFDIVPTSDVAAHTDEAALPAGCLL